MVFSSPVSLRSLLLAAALAGPLPPAQAADLVLGIQPVLSPERTVEVYAPLADYLGERTGHTVHIEPSRNFYSYWTRMNRGEFDLALDAAHFTGYRIRKLGYEVLAALPDTVSYTLVSAGDNLIFSSDELVGKPVATMGPPSLGAIRLEQLYDNPMREPLFRTTNTAEESVEMVLRGEAVAAMVPTPLVSEYPNLNTIQVTAPTPHLAFSAGDRVPLNVRVALRTTLIGMSKDERGREILSQARLAGFVPTDAETYAAFSGLLEHSRVSLHSEKREWNANTTDVALAAPAK
ncbi:MAG: PhnD/SsuA/transferrin family substrate-binding protein [Gammaproteobacteria bacterium]|nr:PhnD/SsuA/transferrin family substrate-binding protein [Gammaproteobacteria bacterium]MCP5136194.1 PhnD/SsuA/transferrin family substrate-binding protein [Gammaproteobacteria bacterium]